MGIERKARIGESPKKYIKCVLGLDRNTQNYVLAGKTGREKLLVKMVRRAMRYEEKMRKQEKGLILAKMKEVIWKRKHAETEIIEDV